MAGRLREKIALVSGAGSVAEGWGNGKAAAALFAREGAHVFAVDVNASAAAETRRLIEEAGGVCESYQADVTRSDEVEEMTAVCLERFGRIDILQNNVGGSAPGGPVEMTEQEWDQQLTFNLKSVFLTCKFVLPVMEQQGRGAIINVGSIAGIRYLGRDMAAYYAAKGGLIQFTRALAMRYAKQGIRANCVIPGLMHTPLVADRIAGQYGAGDVEAMIRERDAHCPTGKMGDAWDVAYASLYLASDEAKYVTATELVVDGGLSARF